MNLRRLRVLAAGALVALGRRLLPEELAADARVEEDADVAPQRPMIMSPEAARMVAEGEAHARAQVPPPRRSRAEPPRPGSLAARALAARRSP